MTDKQRVEMEKDGEEYGLEYRLRWFDKDGVKKTYRDKNEGKEVYFTKKGNWIMQVEKKEWVGGGTGHTEDITRYRLMSQENAFKWLADNGYDSADLPEEIRDMVEL